MTALKRLLAILLAVIIVATGFIASLFLGPLMAFAGVIAIGCVAIIFVAYMVWEIFYTDHGRSS